MSRKPLTLDDYAALSLRELAKILSDAAGKRITIKMLRADLKAGAPVNPDGTVNLVHYAAWLLEQAKRP